MGRKTGMHRHTRVLVLGGGFAGVYCARALERLGGQDFSVTLVDRHNYLLFYPLLVEAGTGTLEARHIAVPLRVLLRRSTYRMGEVVETDLTRNRIVYRVPGESSTTSVSYDQLVLALGSVTSLPPLPGLAEFGYRMKSLADAVALRDRMIQILERADATIDPDERRRLLHVVVVGGSFTGVEVAGEYLSFLKRAARAYPGIDPREIRVTLIEMSERILTALEPDMSAYAAHAMARRGINFILKGSLREIADDHCVLATGQRLETRTVIWCAGIASHPLFRRMNLPTDKKGWVLCERDGRVKGMSNVWGIGDCAVNPDAAGRSYPATAQAAVGEGELVARNIVLATRGRATRPVDLKIKGTITPLGGHNAVVQLGKRFFSGYPAWVVYRIFYLSKIPGFARKARVALDWFGSLFTSADALQLDLHPRRPAPLPERRGYSETLVSAGNGHSAKTPS